MRLPADRQLSRLPKRFPVGTMYVVEGRGGEYGHLRVSSRYLVLPGGRQIDVPADLGRAAPARARVAGAPAVKARPKIRPKAGPCAGQKNLPPGQKNLSFRVEPAGRSHVN